MVARSRHLLPLPLPRVLQRGCVPFMPLALSQVTMRPQSESGTRVDSLDWLETVVSRAGGHARLAAGGALQFASAVSEEDAVST